MHNAVPAFSGRLKTDDFYEAITGIIRTLRPHSSLSVIASHLNRMGFRTATDLEWNKSRVHGFIRNAKDL